MKAKRGLLITGIVIGLLLMLAPLLGALGTVFGMSHAFGDLASPGASDPQALSGSVRTTLISAVAGIVLFPVGVAMLTLSLVFFVRLRRTDPPALPPAQPRA